MYFPVQAKAALFLLASSFFGGFFVATKINQYIFEKSKGKGGGGEEKDREGNEGKKKKGQIAQEEKEEKQGQEGEGQEEEEQGEEGDGEGLKSGAELKGRSAMRFLAGKSVRRNPGPNDPDYAYYVTRGIMGEGKAARFAVRAWFLRKGELCVTNGQGVADCMEFRIITGVPIEGGPDIELSPAQVKKIVQQADWKAKLARQKARAKARAEAEAKGIPYKETGEPEDMTLVDVEDPTMRPAVTGEPVGLMVVGDRALPIIKGNLINFPPFVPTVDDPRLSRTAELAQGAPVEEKPPEAPKPAPPKVAAKAERQPKGFAAPTGRTSSFETPKAADRNAVQKTAVKEEEAKPVPVTEPPVQGAEAWSRMLAKPLAPAGAQPGKSQPFLAYLDSEGRFMQLVRVGTAPFEVTLTMSTWSWRDERICINGLQETRGATAGRRAAERPVTVEKVVTNCFVPSVAGQASNLLNFRNEKLNVVGPEFLNPPPPPVLEPYGPYRPAAFTGVASEVTSSGVAPLAAAASGKIAPVVSKQKGEGVTPVVAKQNGPGVTSLALLWQIFEVHDIFGIPEIHIA